MTDESRLSRSLCIEVVDIDPFDLYDLPGNHADVVLNHQLHQIPAGHQHDVRGLVDLFRVLSGFLREVRGGDECPVYRILTL